MRPVIIIKILPLLQFFIEKPCIINHYAFEHTIKLFFINPVAPFDLSIKSRSSRLYIYVVNPLV